MSENSFASWFIPLASDTSFPLVTVPACGKSERKQIAVPYRSCLGGGVGIVQIYIPPHHLVCGNQVAVYDQKTAIHKHFRLPFSFPHRLSLRSAHEESGITRGQNKKLRQIIVLVKQSVVREYWGWEGWTDGKEADEKMISEMVSPKTSHHLLLLRREDGCGAGRPMGAQLAAWTCRLAPTAAWARRQPQPGSSGNILLKLKVRLPGEALEAFKATTRSSDLTSPALGCRGQSLI